MNQGEQVPSGIAGLDQLLRGGLRRGGLHLVVGAPGAGKTVLAHQIGTHHARAGTNVLYLTALVESHQTLIAQARTFSFFDPSIVGRTFYYASIYPAFEESGLRGVQAEMLRLVGEHDPGIVVLDGLHVLKLLATDTAEYQRFLSALQAQAASTRTTMLALSNRGEESYSDPMFAVTDAILSLDLVRHAMRRMRTIEVLKMRAVAHLTGVHHFTIDADGIRIHPRIEALLAELQNPQRSAAPRPASTGVAGLDTMLGGGLLPASITIVPGVPGAGKSSLAFAFLAAGARAGENGMLLGFHETPDRVLEKARGLSIPLAQAVDTGQVRLVWQQPAEPVADRIAHQILECVDRDRIRRIAIDGLDDLARGLVEQERVLPFLSAFMDLLRARGVAVLATLEVKQVFTVDFVLPLPEIFGTVDNVILLRFVELDSRLRRLVSVLKVRDRDHDSAIRELLITSPGITVGERFAGVDHLLSGLPSVRNTGQEV